MSMAGFSGNDGQHPLTRNELSMSDEDMSIDSETAESLQRVRRWLDETYFDIPSRGRTSPSICDSHLESWERDSLCEALESKPKATFRCFGGFSLFKFRKQ